MKNFTRIKKPILLMLFLLSCIGIKAQTVVTFNTAGTTSFTPPAGVTQVTVEVWGAGGGGGAGTGSPAGGGGGAGGGYVRAVNYAVTPGTPYSIRVGAGGTSSTGANASAGGESYFGGTGVIKAVGGNGGARASSNGSSGAGGGAVSSGNIGFTAPFNYYGGAGGTGSGGTSGGGGSSAGTGSNGNNGGVPTAGAAVTGGAAGGAGGSSGNTGAGGADPGGGGGGGRANSSTDRLGGAGGDGQVRITFDGPEMNVQGNATTIVNGDTTPAAGDWTNFGTTTIGNTITRTFTIQNVSPGNMPLLISAVNITGTHASDFTVTTAPASSVAVSGSTTFVVTFSPTASGTRSATISIDNNDYDENSYDFAIQGTTNASGEIEIRGNLVAIVDGDTTPNQYDGTEFGGTTVGNPLVRNYVIHNLTSGTLYLGATSLSGANAGDFVITTAPPASIAGNSTATFSITFTPGAVGTRTATFSIINSDSNESPYDFAIEGSGQAALSYGPGGVMTNLQLWLRSDLLNGTTGVADGASVNTWSTQARGTDATRPGTVSAPIYRNNPTHNINFNSVVDFQNDYNNIPINYNDNDPTRQYLKGATGFYSHDMYVVLIPDAPMTSALGSNDVFCGDRNPGTNETDATGFGYGRYTQRFNNEVLAYCIGTTNGVGNGYGVAHESGSTSWSSASIINARNNATTTGTEFQRDANDIVNSTSSAASFTNVTDSRYWIGKSEGWEGSLDGKVAEVITYSSRATDIEKSNIQSYLAIKYGITLGVNGTSMNYTNSDGNVIWDATANAGFNYDIAGIGRDDISKLTQKQSKSINTTEVMTIGLTDIAATNTANTATFATNKSYLVWGANGGTMVDSGVNLDIDLGPTTITTITEVVNRKWKVVETGGDVGVTRVAIPTASFLSGLPALGATDAYVMVVATNATFTTGLETVFMSTTGGNQTCLYDFDGTKYITFGVAHRAVNPLHITLDGMDDFVRIDNVNEISNAFTIMTWIRPNGANTLGDERTILSKKAASASGYQLVLQTDNRVRMEWTVSGTTYSLVTNTAIPNQKWHNIAVTYGSNILNIYIDGVLDKTATITTAPVGTTASFSIGGQYVDKLTINNLFKGDIDELRMWDKVVTLPEIRYIMNQEILENGAGTRGTIMPTTVTKNEINTLNWNNLYAYYSMNSYIGTHLDDDSYNINRGSLVIPDKVSINIQTAPMPYDTTTNGLWATNGTWLNGAIQDVPCSLSIVDNTTPIDWNIIRTNHNIDSSGNKTLLGMFVNANTVSATNDSKIEVSHYLKLDGKIDLTGMSQLVQTLNSDLDPTSSGSIERDQQGQKSFHNYNYWCSPVGAINNTTNNNAYTVNGVMKDGTTSTPQNITWTSGLNGSATSPITLSTFWIYKFQNLSAAYANWSAVGQNGSLNAAQGYTLKGSNAPTATQNYTFVGKPNNGLITTTVAANNTNLSGNPYASALDAHAFIDANAFTITGTLYFWEHFASNNTHNLLAYQGGYSQLTKVGSTAAITFPGLSGLGSSTKAPGRYIPVGQGFFIVGSATGGTVTFNNNQRAFFREDNTLLSNTLFRNSANSSMLSVDHFNDNSEDAVAAPENFKKVRLGFDDRNGYHRQTLLGFMNENATSGIDPGYDAVHLDSQPNDMYFMNGTTKLNISGEGVFDYNNQYPVSVKTDGAGTVTFRIDDKENFDNTVGFYIYDGLTNIYHDITNESFSIEVPQGNIDNRFRLTFKQENVLTTSEFGLENGILIAYTSADSMLNIKNNLTDATVEKVTLFNLLGQSIGEWSVQDLDQQNIQLHMQRLSTATYIVKVKTDKGDMSRKIIIN